MRKALLNVFRQSVGLRRFSSQPTIPFNFQKSPHKVDIKDGPKWICMCLHSQKFPYCDGSHSKLEGEKKRQPFKADPKMLNTESVWVCGCGWTNNRDKKNTPFCDGSHSKKSASS
eukprot:TRINITY_DN3350_c0_g1_i1.p1 TRINITY_DN3350_c0_g1~~TRINITY_DN3350_c0_g1_i1.p1  ORF type:complete len:115 (+),score=0.23 TRINITY_DN3350_c0_g1_i1:64-408(+)